MLLSLSLSLLHHAYMSERSRNTSLSKVMRMYAQTLRLFDSVVKHDSEAEIAEAWRTSSPFSKIASSLSVLPAFNQPGIYISTKFTNIPLFRIEGLYIY